MDLLEVTETRKEVSSYKYVAFISYRRTNSHDAYLLRNGLQRFRFPMDKVEPENRPDGPYIRKIAIDKEVLNPNDDFVKEIHKKIDQSRFLIVMCSREAVLSPIIEDEIDYFLKSRGEDAIKYIIPVLVNGIPNAGNEVDECLPRPLLEKFGEQIAKQNLPTMFPSSGESLSHARECAIVLTAAYILRVDRDSIYDEFQQQKRKSLRFRLQLTSLLSLLFMFLTVLACYYWRAATIARNLEQIAKKEAIATLSVSDFQEASRLIDNRKDIPNSLVWLGGSLSNYYCAPAAQRLYELLAQRSWLVDRGKVSPDLFRQQSDKEMLWREKIISPTLNCQITPGNTDPSTGLITWKITLPPKEEEASNVSTTSCNVQSIDEPQAILSPGKEFLYIFSQRDAGDYYLELRSVLENKTLKERNFFLESPRQFLLSPDGIHLVIEFISNDPDKENRLSVLDSYSLETILDIPSKKYWFCFAFSHDSRLLAVLQNKPQLQVFDLWKRKPFTEMKYIPDIQGEVFFSSDDRFVFYGNEDLAHQYEIQASPLAPREINIEKGNMAACTSIPGTEQILQWSHVYDMALWICSYDFATGKSIPIQKVEVNVKNKMIHCNFDGIFAKPVLFANQTRIGFVAEVDGEAKWISFQVSPETIMDFKKWKQKTVLDLPCSFRNSYISPDDRWLVLGGPINAKDKKIQMKVYDLKLQKWVEEIQSSGTFMDAAFDSTSSTLCVSSIGGTEIWKRTGETWTREDFSQYPEMQKILKSTWGYARFSHQGLLGLSYKSDYVLLDLPQKKVVLYQNKNLGSLVSTPCCFSEDGTKVAFCISPTEVKVFDTATGVPITSPLEHPYEVQSVNLFTVKNQLILCCNTSSTWYVNPAQGALYRGTIILWDVPTNRRIIDHVPTNQNVIYTQLVSSGGSSNANTDVPSLSNVKLFYATSQKIISTNILDLSPPTSVEEEQILQKLLPLLCRKYGGGFLNSWRAPVFTMDNVSPLETFCQSLTEAQKQLPQVKKWLDMDRWISLPMEQRTTMPGGTELLLPWLEKFAKLEPKRCLETNPLMAAAWSSWIPSQGNQITEKDYIFGVDNQKKFSRVTVKREQVFIEKLVKDGHLDYKNPRARFYLDYVSQVAYERSPKNIEILKLRSQILQNLGRKEEAKQINQTILDLID